MADANDTPNPDELGKQVKELTAKLEATQKSIEDLTKDRDEWRGKFEDSKSSRDKAKEKEREEAKKRGEYEEVVKSLEEKIQTLESQTAKMAELEQAKAKLDAMQAKMREDLIAKLPEDKREAAKDLSVEQLQFAVSLLPEEERVIVDGKKRTGGDLLGKSWWEMSSEERVEFSRAHPDKVKEKMHQSSRR